MRNTPSRLLAYLLRRLLVGPSREPDLLIGPANDPYLRRWFLVPQDRERAVRPRWWHPLLLGCNLYLHHMRHDDDDRAAHDHPYWSVSLCLQGVIHEMVFDPRRGTYAGRRVSVGSLIYRDSTFAHRLELPAGSAWTLFLTGPRLQKDWGFWCPRGWVHRRRFLGPDEGGELGMGCGEVAGARAPR